MDYDMTFLVTLRVPDVEQGQFGDCQYEIGAALDDLLQTEVTKLGYAERLLGVDYGPVRAYRTARVR